MGKNKRYKKLQKEELIRINTEKCNELADKNWFKYVGFKPETSCVMYEDLGRLHRLDIFVTTMTICLVFLRSDEENIYYRNQTFSDLSRIMFECNTGRRKMTKGY